MYETAREADSRVYTSHNYYKDCMFDRNKLLP